MKNLLINLFLSIFILFGCSNNQTKTTLCQLDFSKKYPKKDYYIQDYAKVDYIQLESSEQYPFYGKIHVYDDEIMIGKNYNDPNIFIFSREGKILKVFSRSGKGPEEYGETVSIRYDKAHKEIYVKEAFGEKTLIFDLDGNFKRVFKVDSKVKSSDLVFWNNECYLCDISMENEGDTYSRISLESGKVAEKIHIGYEKRIGQLITKKQASGSVSFTMSYAKFVIGENDIIFNEISNDTIFTYSKQKELKPVLVKTPKISMTDPVQYVCAKVNTDKFIDVMSVIKDIPNENGIVINDFLEQCVFYYIVEKETNKIFQRRFLNKDAEGDKFKDYGNQANSQEYLRAIEAVDLIEAKDKNWLTGELKLIAQNLNEDSNPIIMVTKFK
jgi:hypothetical protein